MIIIILTDSYIARYPSLWPCSPRQNISVGYRRQQIKIFAPLFCGDLVRIDTFDVCKFFFISAMSSGTKFITISQLFFFHGQRRHSPQHGAAWSAATRLIRSITWVLRNERHFENNKFINIEMPFIYHSFMP